MMEQSENKAEWVRVRCDCCGTETLAYIHAGKLTISANRHGRNHTAVILLSEGLTIVKSSGITKLTTE